MRPLLPQLPSHRLRRCEREHRRHDAVGDLAGGAEYTEVFYNRRSPHSGTGYRTPARVWTDHRATQDLPQAA